MENDIIIWYIIAILNSAFAGILAKYYVLENKILYLYAAIFCNVFLICAYVNIFKSTDISTEYACIKVIAIIFVSVIGIIFLNEPCNINKIMGIIFALLAIYLLSIKDEK